MSPPDVIWLWPEDSEWHAIGLEIEGAVRYVRRPVPQRLEDFDENEDDVFEDWRSDPERICVGCGQREAILNHCCGMCTELHPERM